MNKITTLFCWVIGGICLWTGIWFADDILAPMVLDSRLERLGETGLPRASVKNGVIHCRMKADDFRFPLPQGTHVVLPIKITGGFDTVDGSVEARFDDSAVHITPYEYEVWLSKKLQEGASVKTRTVPDGLLIEFHYFGDK